MIGETRCDGCHGNTAATIRCDVSGCFGNSSGLDNVWQREVMGGGDACLFKLVKLTYRELKFFHSSEQRFEIKEKTFMDVE